MIAHRVNFCNDKKQFKWNIPSKFTTELHNFNFQILLLSVNVQEHNSFGKLAVLERKQWHPRWQISFSRLLKGTKIVNHSNQAARA